LISDEHSACILSAVIGDLNGSGVPVALVRMVRMTSSGSSPAPSVTNGSLLASTVVPYLSVIASGKALVVVGLTELSADWEVKLRAVACSRNGGRQTGSLVFELLLVALHEANVVVGLAILSADW
jgi:NADH:ubiquinone oxidoreductase subunit K